MTNKPLHISTYLLGSCFTHSVCKLVSWSLTSLFSTLYCTWRPSGWTTWVTHCVCNPCFIFTYGLLWYTRRRTSKMFIQSCVCGSSVLTVTQLSLLVSLPLWFPQNLPTNKLSEPSLSIMFSSLEWPSLRCPCPNCIQNILVPDMVAVRQL